MAIVNIDPDSEKFPEIRRGGKYGPGCPNPAECSIAGYRSPQQLDADENTPDFVRERYGRASEGKGAHKFTFKVVEADQTVYHDQFEPAGKLTRSRALAFVKGSGCPMDANGSFDDEQLVGRQVVLEFSDPKPGKKDPNRKFTNVLSVVGIG